jgi:hypothetical protein
MDKLYRPYRGIALRFLRSHRLIVGLSCAVPPVGMTYRLLTFQQPEFSSWIFRIQGLSPEPLCGLHRQGVIGRIGLFSESEIEG